MDRPRRSHTAASDSSAACSDSEASTSYLNRGPSVPNLDKRDLQRAVAHLQETLQHRMAREQDSLAGSGAAGHSEVKAVVHRGPEAKTLDGQSIKQYESIKLNQYHLGPYETIKPSRLKRKGSASAAGAGGATAGSSGSGQGSGDIATLDLSATKPPLMGPKPNLEKKRDSFEGHEEAVRTIVEAVQESRKQQQQQQQQQQQPSNSKRTNNSDTT